MSEQPREHPVPCQRCYCLTWETDAICLRHKRSGVNQTGAGVMQDKRTKRNRDRAARERQALEDQEM